MGPAVGTLLELWEDQDVTNAVCPVNGKVCYKRKNAAAAARSLKFRMVSAWRIVPYKCPDHDRHPKAMFHIGHAPKRRRR